MKTYAVTVTTDGNGTASADPSTTVAGAGINLSAAPNTGYHFKEWQVVSGGVTIENDRFTMPDGDVEVKAIFEKDAASATPAPTATAKPESSPAPAAKPPVWWVMLPIAGGIALAGGFMIFKKKRRR